ncbi:MAG: ABC transporter ATP-binding protein [Chloroflexota bacterium]|nr:ABC transporter ATP-binding protein [Chloroflexota bacterium]MDE3193395.1 ABC transporter ATP-binding protein [Chloroflexota bacterium]
MTASATAPAKDAARKGPERSTTVVDARGLTKRYESVVAVDGLDLKLREGEIFGLLGPNGAGKTTTILMLMGLTEPTAGDVRVLGFDPRHEPLEVKRRVGYLPEHVALYDDLSARSNLLYTADLNGIRGQEARDIAESALERVALADMADRKVRELSHGMRQRLGIADVLVKRPRLIVLDEPTLGLDPVAVEQLLDLILRAAREEGITVLLSSHQLMQVQRICDRVGIFARGKMVASGPIAELAEQLAEGLTVIELGAEADAAQVADALRAVRGVVDVMREGALWRVRAHGDVRPQLARAVIDRGWPLAHLRLRDFGLEEIYLRYFERTS